MLLSNYEVMVSVIVVKSLLLLFINTFLPLYIYTNVHYILLSVNIDIHFHNSLSIHIKNLLSINILIAYYRLTLKVHSIHTSITYCLYSFAKFLSIYLTTFFLIHINNLLTIYFANLLDIQQQPPLDVQ